jgi:membrane protein required for colicin V production
MIGGIPWPDLIFIAVMAFSIVKGYTRGFVKELGGLFAVAAGLIAPWYYNGAADWIIAKYTDLGPPFAHAAGMVATGVIAYGIVMTIVLIVGAIVKLPILGFGNKLAGGFVGFVKAYAFLWLTMFVMLFFPLTPVIRHNLHESRLAPFFTAYDSTVDQAFLGALPTFAKPFLAPYFENHHV